MSSRHSTWSISSQVFAFVSILVLGACALYLGNDAITGTLEDDEYQKGFDLKVHKAGRVELTMTWDDVASDLELWLHDSSLYAVGVSTRSEPGRALLIRDVPEGDYRIRVMRSTGARVRFEIKVSAP